MKSLLPENIQTYLLGAGLIDPDAALDVTALSGGVASDIWRVASGDKVFCVKKALAEMKVADEWKASVARNAYEVAWFKEVVKIVPRSVPNILAHDLESGCFVMDYLPPEKYPIWKAELREGNTDAAVARSVAKTLVTIHAATANSREIKKRFATDDLFDEMRIDPYLNTVALRHDDIAAEVLDIANITRKTKLALVHGDISPKNILCGAEGAIILDAEAAWYGDPAFDLAFFLNHMLLKCMWNPAARDGYLMLFDEIVKAYRPGISWEAADTFQARVAKLLPALMLARIDGKSPVEYITDESNKTVVRNFSKEFIKNPVKELSLISKAWGQKLSDSQAL